MARRQDDPDETEGRKLYRDRADSLAGAQQNIAARTVRLIRDDARDVIPGPQARRNHATG
jgi:hypothetical protein